MDKKEVVQQDLSTSNCFLSVGLPCLSCYGYKSMYDIQ